MKNNDSKSYVFVVKESSDNYQNKFYQIPFKETVHRTPFSKIQYFSNLKLNEIIQFFASNSKMVV